MGTSLPNCPTTYAKYNTTTEIYPDQESSDTESLYSQEKNTRAERIRIHERERKTGMVVQDRTSFPVAMVFLLIISFFYLS